MTESRFWSRVDKTDTCWLWTGPTTGGYGQLWWKGRQARAHRVSYELLVGPIPEGLPLDHLCRVPPCVNPDHLEPVTVRENTLRGVGTSATNFAKTHCVNGHEFTPENTWVSKQGYRRCRACAHSIDQVRYASLRAQRDQRRDQMEEAQCTVCDGTFVRSSWGVRQKNCSDECRIEGLRQSRLRYAARKRQERLSN